MARCLLRRLSDTDLVYPIDARAAFRLNGRDGHAPATACRRPRFKLGRNGVMMATNSLIVILIIGLIAGWLAGKLMGGGFGLIGDIVVGVIGAFVGGWLWMTLHLPVFGPWWLTAIVSAVVGACILLFILRLIRR
jgi:uncharacterized membrane protein YeaQ/YmgE (transglycosylase-associated protein family)